MTPSPPPRRTQTRLWLARPAGPLPTLLVAAFALAAPVWLWADPLDGYSPRAEGLSGPGVRLAPLADPFGRNRLQLDDFDYVARSRTPADLARNLFEPHNTHVVPLYRLWAFAWLRAAGSLERAPGALGLASYLTYALALLTLGHVVAWETHRPAFGLGVMAFFGVVGLLEPTVHWFAADQAVAAGAASLAGLAVLQLWRSRGGWWCLAGAALAAACAPLVWSAGYVAGPAGAAYLWADGRSRARRAAVVPLLGSAAAALLSFAVAGPKITAAENFHDRTLAQAVNPVQGGVTTVQGVVEILALRNLGLASETSPPQALLLFAGLAAAWAWSRGRPWRPNPLEAAGATLALLGFGLVHTARGYFTFESLRDLSWYQAVPQFGAALFAAGWWQGRVGPDHLPMRVPVLPSRGGVLGVAGVVLVALVLQAPRVRARVEATAPPLLKSEEARFPAPKLRRARARYLDAELAAWQRRFLARLDRAEAVARGAGWTREDLRRGLGRVLGGGMPSHVPRIDGVNLLALPESGPGPGADPAAVRAALGFLVQPEPEPRPPWLEPGEPWPDDPEPRRGGGP